MPPTRRMRSRALLVLAAWQVLLGEAAPRGRHSGSISNVELLIPLLVADTPADGERSWRVRPDDDAAFSSIPAAAFSLDRTSPRPPCAAPRLLALLCGAARCPCCRRDYTALGDNADMVLRHMHAPRRRPPSWLAGLSNLAEVSW